MEIREPVRITLKDLTKPFGLQNLGQIERVPKSHSGWQSVAYKGRRYQLHGGIRTDLFINIGAKK